MYRLFKDGGFKILEEQFGKWPELPISRSSLNKEFHKYSDVELTAELPTSCFVKVYNAATTVSVAITCFNAQDN